MRASIMTWRTGTSILRTRARTCSSRDGVSCTNSVFVRVSITALPRLERIRWSLSASIFWNARANAAKAPENPMFVPQVDRDLLWDALVDTLDDYFRIQHEEPVRLVGNILMEGRVSTYPTTGSTLLEPWRTDSTPGFERLHSTLQSIRRWAACRVIPTEGGFLVEVIVNKELEDVDRPERSSVSAGTNIRHDGSLVRHDKTNKTGSNTLGWSPLGRDPSLEEKILVELRGKLTHLDGPARLPVPRKG